MNFFRRNPEPLNRIDDMEGLTEALRALPAVEQKRRSTWIERPGVTFAPKGVEYSIEHVQAFLSRHIQEMDEADHSLAIEEEAAEKQLAEIRRRREVTRIARDALGIARGNLADRMAAMDAPPKSEEPDSPQDDEHEQTDVK